MAEVTGDRSWLEGVRRATRGDEPFLFAVFSTVWESEVAAMPNPNLVQHFLRIQYTAQERRFQARHPGFERWVIEHVGEPAGRFYLHRSPELLHILDMTLLPVYRSKGIGTRLVSGVMAEAAANGQTVTLRVARRNVRAATLYDDLGFRLVTMDDQDCYFEWSPTGRSAR